MNKIFFENVPLGTHLFGRFILREVIATNDSCGIFKVLSTWGETRGQILALKVMSAGSHAAASEAQLIQEIRLLAKLNSPHVVRAYDWFKDDNFIAYSMEYLGGGCLERKLLSAHKHSLTDIIELIEPIALGLQDIHRVGIIHRDIKPQNILLSVEGRIKIADFGIAVRKNTAYKELDNQINGTVDFLSPETILDGTYDQRSDIYAWGTLAYLALTGRLPFEDPSIVEAMTRKASIDPASPREHRLDIPEWLEKVVLSAIARNPENRFQTTEELLYSLRNRGHTVRNKTTLFKSLEFLGLEASDVAV